MPGVERPQLNSAASTARFWSAPVERLLLTRILAIPPAWQIGHALPPHPNPLPWGEGERFPIVRRTGAVAIAEPVDNGAPSPQGRGSRRAGALRSAVTDRLLKLFL